MNSQDQAARILRRIGKIWSFLSIAFLLTIFVGEVLTGSGPLPTPMEWLGLALFPIGVLAGLVLAWRWEGLGGGLAVASLLAFYLWNFAQGGRFPRGPYFGLVAAPGLLYLVCWLLTRKRHAQV